MTRHSCYTIIKPESSENIHEIVAKESTQAKAVL